MDKPQYRPIYTQKRKQARNLFDMNNNGIKPKNTILKLARSSMPEKQKTIYAGRQHF